MKLLLVSDLHAQRGKLDWVRTHAGAFDVIAVAGDLLDIFTYEDSAWQKKRVLKWRDEIVAAGTTLVWSSGNHDFFDGKNSPMIMVSPDWMVGDFDNFIGDGMTRLIQLRQESLAVTTVPWPVTAGDVVTTDGAMSYIDFVEQLLEEGKRLQRSHPWLVLFHEPPLGLQICADYSTSEARYARLLVERSKPDWSLHGHVHGSALHPDGNFIDFIGPTVCFNAGQAEADADPHYIMLQFDPLRWTARWVCESESRVANGNLFQRSLCASEDP